MSNSVTLVSTKDMPREEWLRWRSKGIGGSDAGVIAGVNKWKSPVELYLEKIGEGIPPEAGESAYWGTVLEDVVAKEFETRHGFRVQKVNEMLQHKEHPFMIGNIDRLILSSAKHDKPGILECKTTSVFNKDAWEDDNIPDSYLIQVQHYLAVTGYEYAYIAVLIGGQRYMDKFIPRDDELIEILIKKEQEFWNCVETGNPPEFDGSDASSNLLSSLFPESQPTEIQLFSEAGELIDQYEEAKELERTYKGVKEEACNKLKNMLGENEAGIYRDKKVVWKSFTTNRLDSKKLKAEKPDVYEEYIKESPSRRFDIKGVA